MKKFIVAMGAALLATTAAFAQLGPKPQVSGKELSFDLPFSKVQIIEVSDFKVDFPKDENGREICTKIGKDGQKTHTRYVWLYFTAKVKNPSGKRILLKDFEGHAALRHIDRSAPVVTTGVDEKGQPIVKKQYSDLVLGSYYVAVGQIFELASNDSEKQFMIGLGPISDGDKDTLNIETRNKLITLFNIFANGGTRGEYELHLTGKANPGILGDNGAWVFGEKIDYMWVFEMKEGSGIVFNVKATDSK